MTADTPAWAAALHARCFTRPRPWTAAEFSALLLDPLVFLLRRDQAFLLGRVVADEAELLTLAVDPDRRRKGLARSLLTAFEAEAEARGATDAFLEVAADNAPARALYLSAGYVVTGRRPRYYRGPDGSREDAEIMGKTFG